MSAAHKPSPLYINGLREHEASAIRRVVFVNDAVVPHRVGSALVARAGDRFRQPFPLPNLKLEGVAFERGLALADAILAQLPGSPRVVHFAMPVGGVRGLDDKFVDGLWEAQGGPETAEDEAPVPEVVPAPVPVLEAVPEAAAPARGEDRPVLSRDMADEGTKAPAADAGATTLSLSRDMAESFLRHVFPDRGKFTFQQFHDKRKSGAKNFTGTLAQCWPQIEKSNLAGHGMFFALNEANGKGLETGDIEGYGGVVAADFDKVPPSNRDRLPLKPHAIVTTSPGKAHVYWRVAGVPLEQWPDFQKRLVALFGSDANICNKGRVLRLPGTLHQKGEPFLVTWEDGGAPEEPYPLDEFTAALEAAEKAHGIVPGAKASRTASSGSGEVDKGKLLGSREEVAALLKLIPNGEEYADDRARWIEVGHAVKGACGGEGWGFELWEEWSWQQQQADDLFERYDGFNDVRSGIGTLREMAKEANPGGYARALFDALPVKPKTRAEAMAERIWNEAQHGQGDASGDTGLGTLDDFLAHAATLKPVPDMVPGYVRAGECMLHTAPSGMGKSALMAHVAVCCMTGTDVRDATKSMRPAHVFALFGEDIENVVADRMKAMRQNYANGRPATKLFKRVINRNFTLASLDTSGRLGGSPPPAMTHLCAWLLEVLDRHLRSLDEGGSGEDGVVLILDMLAHFSNANKNAGNEAAATMAVLKAIMTVFEDMDGPPIGIMFSMHDTKAASRDSKPNASNTTAGAGEWEGRVRLVRRDIKKGNILTSTVTKSNNGQTGVSDHFEFVSVPSMYAGQSDTFWLKPVSQSAMAALVQIEESLGKLHAWMSANPSERVTITKEREGFVTIHKVLTDYCGEALPPPAADVAERGIAAGAFKDHRHRKPPPNGYDMAGIVSVEGWTPALGGDGDEDGSLADAAPPAAPTQEPSAPILEPSAPTAEPPAPTKGPSAPH